MIHNTIDNIDIYSNNSDNSDNNSDEDITIKNYYWAPNTSIIKIIENFCLSNKYNKVLEIGPGKKPFSLSTNFIGINETLKCIDVDIDIETLPFTKDEFHFIYCRHVLEDIQNPDFALNNFFRVSKFGGYIETPSPLIEITKNVDAHSNASTYCGYIHHRYIVWSNIKKNEIYFLPKYSCILDNMLNTKMSSKYINNLINNYPIYWNNYFLFCSENKPKIIMYKNGVNFNNTPNSNMAIEYINLLSKAVNESIENTNYFIQTYSTLIQDPSTFHFEN